jgi:short-subunit dehydrogenase
MKVMDKTWVVTGAGSGMGRALTLRMIRAGARVAAVDYNREALEETKNLVADPAKLSTHLVDVTDYSQVNALVGEVADQHGCVDGLVNNAGIMHPFGSFTELPLAHMEKVVAVNWWGVVYLLKAFMPTLLARPEAQIVNVSSMGGFLAMPNISVYGASKAAVKMLSEVLMLELKHTSIQTSVVFPGSVVTHFAANSPDLDEATRKKLIEFSDKEGVGLSPTDAAEIIFRGLEKGKPRIYVGKDSRMMDILYRISPRLALSRVSRLAAKQMPNFD